MGRQGDRGIGSLEKATGLKESVIEKERLKA